MHPCHKKQQNRRRDSYFPCHSFVLSEFLREIETDENVFSDTTHVSFCIIGEEVTEVQWSNEKEGFVGL